MKKSTFLLVAVFFCSVLCARAQTRTNAWESLFDGKTLKGWKSATRDTLPDKCWSVESGTIAFDPIKGHGGDIITTRSFKDFDLSVDFKVSEGAIAALNIS